VHEHDADLAVAEDAPVEPRPVDGAEVDGLERRPVAPSAAGKS
jgi:hypothetical protein